MCLTVDPELYPLERVEDDSISMFNTLEEVPEAEEEFDFAYSGIFNAGLHSITPVASYLLLVRFLTLFQPHLSPQPSRQPHFPALSAALIEFLEDEKVPEADRPTFELSFPDPVFLSSLRQSSPAHHCRPDHLLAQYHIT